MKKMIALILTGIMVFTLTAYAKGAANKKAEPENQSESETQMEDIEKPAQLPGGWSDGSVEITDDIQALVDKATAELIGADYTAVAYIGRQIVNGTNHRILCKIKPVTPSATAHFAVVTIYEDLQGNAKVSNILDCEAGAEESGALGGWKAAEDVNVTEEAKAALDKALEELVGAEYKPVALLATQLVSGMNYELLCEVTPVALNAESSYAIVHVYQALDGSARITEVFNFNEI